MADTRVPVLILSGWLGAGKTTLVKHLLANTVGKRIGVLVNDMAAVNVDAGTLGRVVQHKEDMVEFSNGCICCTLRADFVQQLADLASTQPRFDYLIVESSGISEPQQVAEAFDLPSTTDDDGDGDEEDEEQQEEEDEGEGEEEDAEAAAKAEALAASTAKLRSVARLDCTVTVVDCFNFPRDMAGSTDSLADRGMAVGEADERSVAELLVEQVEFADVLVLNKTDLVSASELSQTRALLTSLNPEAKMLSCTQAVLDPMLLLGTGLFSMDKARASPGWLRSLAELHVPESVEFGITHCLFRARLPFHPARLYKLLFGHQQQQKQQAEAAVDDAEAVPAPGHGQPVQDYPAGHPLAGVVRSKGTAWLAAEWGALQELQWAQAGRVWQFSPGGPWAAAIPREDWPVPGTAEYEDIMRRWQGSPRPSAAGGDSGAVAVAGTKDTAADVAEPVGDRQQEVVLIGIHMDKEAVLAALGACLVTQEEWSVYTLATSDCMDCMATAQPLKKKKKGRYGKVEAAKKILAGEAWAGNWGFEVEAE